ncbi:hypothetical protein AJ80_06879 [Polytolypa hystricis UAMH7299]|uniref:BHLH domain-containing protein n=1 Tax=Polytolypa hystricis (strain UAMH7299) TaxID=1447883 RepID=A0A2B7XSU1_POLH7|nr:hypothetical protein AJ80_06879 [Polytolypa hystricis UAMH7299]
MQSTSHLDRSLSPSGNSPSTAQVTPTSRDRANSTSQASSPPRDNHARGSTAAAAEKPRLTEQEKKSNHIASEQKRRAAIREGFDRLTELVPGLEGQGRSEGIVLRKTVDYMRQQLQERSDLVAEIERRGGTIEDGMRV